jgi:hypothetical protein
MVSLVVSIFFRPEPTLAAMYFPLAIDCKPRRFQPAGAREKAKSDRLGHCGAGGQAWNNASGQPREQRRGTPVA